MKILERKEQSFIPKEKFFEHNVSLSQIQFVEKVMNIDLTHIVGFGG